MKEQDKLKCGLAEVLKRTFKVIDNVYSESKPKDEPDSRLIFPQKRDKTYRVSEQELRFIFVDQFIKYCSENPKEFDYYYSVEAPTQYVYRFPHNNEEPPMCSKENADGMESASIDLAIYKKDLNNTAAIPLAIIEFKKDGCSAHEIAKDFLKLSVEPSTDKLLRCFIMISSSDTLLKKKTKKGETSGLWKSFKDKTEKNCFLFDNSVGLLWNEIDIFWHRLPSKTKIDRYDFHTTYNFEKGKLQHIS